MKRNYSVTSFLFLKAEQFYFVNNKNKYKYIGPKYTYNDMTMVIFFSNYKCRHDMLEISRKSW